MSSHVSRSIKNNNFLSVSIAFLCITWNVFYLRSCQQDHTGSTPTFTNILGKRTLIRMTLQKQARSIDSLSLIGLILAIFLPPVGFVISVIAWTKSRTNPIRSQGLAIAGTATGGILTIIPLVFFAWLFISLGGFKDNQAETDFKPIARQITAMGGQKICSNGDDGYGIDNTVPWYQVYYSIPDAPDLTTKVKGLAAEQGYNLSENSNLIKNLQDQNVAFGDEGPNARSDYLVGKHSKTSLEITINRQTSVPLYCGVSDYGKRRATGNDAIIDFKLTLPEVSR